MAYCCVTLISAIKCPTEKNVSSHTVCKSLTVSVTVGTHSYLYNFSRDITIKG